MGIKEMAKLIGTEVLIRTESWNVPMWIQDVKETYGKVRLLVTPVHGSGAAWVDESRVRGTIPNITSDYTYGCEQLTKEALGENEERRVDNASQKRWELLRNWLLNNPKDYIHINDVVTEMLRLESEIY